MTTNDTGAAADEEQSPQRDIEAWKHFADMGAKDKNTMVTTVSWLLAFAAATIAYVVTDENMLDSDLSAPSHPIGMVAVSFGGFVVSTVAGYVTLLYGGYTNVNWAKADAIATRNQWRDLLPVTLPSLKAAKTDGSRLANVAWHLAGPCDPLTELAPVFRVYWYLALGAATIHAAFFAWALAVVCCREQRRFC